MCVPLAVGLAIVSGIQTVVSYVGEKQQAKETQKAINKDYKLQQETLAEKQKQIDAAANQEKSKRAIEALKERGRLNAAAGETGLSGNVFDRLQYESEFNTSQDLSTIETNRANQAKQTSLEAKGVRASAQSKLNENRGPSLISAGLQLASAGLQGKAGYDAAKAAK